MFKKIICFVLCLVMIFCLCSCGSDENKSSKNENNTQQAPGTKDISMLYCKADSFNPYSAVSDINRNLCKLLYEPLFKTDNSYNVVYCLAEKVSYGDLSCTVQLKSSSFTDGSPVTAEDVVYSYNLAKSDGEFSAKLYRTTGISAVSQNTVTFNLTVNDPYILNLLDFPIVKAGSDVITNSDGIVQPPIGCGRYILSADKSYLYLNEDYYGSKGAIKKIQLIDTPDKDAVSHYVEVGAVSFYYADLSDGHIVRMSGKKTDINLNNLIYIGINDSYGRLSEKNVRYAISSALDRTDICSNAFHNNATPATGFFNPAFQETGAVQSLSDKSNLQITIENLNKIGYNSVDDEGYRINSRGKRLTFKLLVNSENLFRVSAAHTIAAQLKAAGIEITVVEKPFDQYLQDLSSGNFQLYLGEISILQNMDLSPLVVKGGSAAFGVGLGEAVTTTPTDPNSPPATDPVAESLAAFYEGRIPISDVAGILLTEMPQIPICYRKSILFYSDSISGLKASESDIYFNIESYSYNNHY